MRTATSILLLLLLIGPGATPANADMAFPGRAWQEAAPDSQGVDAGKLREAVEYFKKNSGRDGVEEMVILRNGRVLWKGAAVDKQHGVWSVTKSFTSTVLGLLIEDGKCKLDTLAREHEPALARDYPEVTLRHFTTMTSGYRADGDETTGSYKHGPSATPFVPSAKPLFPPGSHYAYWDSAMNEFGLVLTRIAGEPIEEVFRKRIAEPIGMDPKQWDWGDLDKVDGLVINGGSGNQNKHVVLNALQLARLGHLFLNKGKWNGKPLLSEDWVKAATSVQVPAKLPWGHKESGIDGRGVYGFNWWVNGIKPDGERKWPDAPVGTFAARGHNNNSLFVIPEWNMVIVRLGLDQRDGAIADSVYSGFLKKVGAAIVP